MGFIPDAKDIAKIVEQSMKPTMDAMNELLTQQVELSALMVEMQHAQLRGRVADPTLDARVHAELANSQLLTEERSNVPA